MPSAAARSEQRIDLLTTVANLGALALLVREQPTIRKALDVMAHTYPCTVNRSC